MQYDLTKYEKAFALLGTNYEFQVPDAVRQAMVFIALNIDFNANENKESVQNLFGSTSGFLRNDAAINNTLTQIKATAQLGLNRLYAEGEIELSETELAELPEPPEPTELEEAEIETHEAYETLVGLLEPHGLDMDFDIGDLWGMDSTDLLRIVAAKIDLAYARHCENEIRERGTPEAEAAAAGE